MTTQPAPVDGVTAPRDVPDPLQPNDSGGLVLAGTLQAIYAPPHSHPTTVVLLCSYEVSAADYERLLALADRAAVDGPDGGFAPLRVGSVVTLASADAAAQPKSGSRNAG